MQQNQALPPEIMAMLGIVIAVMVVVLGIVLIIAIFYLLTLHRALNRVSPENRLMEPGMVWLMLIPLFNIVWQFFVAYRVPGSLQNEFQSRGRDDGGDYGRSIGLARAYIDVGNLFLGLASNAATLAFKAPEVGMAISLFSNVLGLVNLVLFIIFWIKIANYSSILANDEGGGYRDRRRLDDFDDDDYGRGGPPRGGDSPPSDGIKADDEGRYK